MYPISLVGPLTLGRDNNFWPAGTDGHQVMMLVNIGRMGGWEPLSPLTNLIII